MRPRRGCLKPSNKEANKLVLPPPGWQNNWGDDALVRGKGKREKRGSAAGRLLRRQRRRRQASGGAPSLRPPDGRSATCSRRRACAIALSRNYFFICFTCPKLFLYVQPPNNPCNCRPPWQHGRAHAELSAVRRRDVAHRRRCGCLRGWVAGQVQRTGVTRPALMRHVAGVPCLRPLVCAAEPVLPAAPPCARASSPPPSHLPFCLQACP